MNAWLCRHLPALARLLGIDCRKKPPPAPKGPIAVLSASPAGPLGAMLDASASLAGTNLITAYSFDFGDNTPVFAGPDPAVGHTYIAAGSYPVSVTVRDSIGLEDTATSSVTVEGPPPPPPPTVPGPVVGATVQEVTDTTALVTWSPPTDDGGSWILAYDVEQTPGSGFATTALEVSFTGLVPDHEYSLDISARNEVGNGPSVQVTFRTFPSDPPPPPPVEAHCVLGGNTTVARGMGLPSFDYLSWDAIDGVIDLAPGCQFLHIRLGTRSQVEGANQMWDEIAGGGESTRVQRWGEWLADQAPMAVASPHEPSPHDSNSGEGSKANLKAAIARVVTAWRAVAPQHLYCGGVLIRQVYDHMDPDAQIPVDVQDAVGVDGYGGQSNDGFHALAPELFDPALAFAKANGLPLVVFETAFKNAAAGQQRAYFGSLDAWAKANPEVIGIGLYLAQAENALNPEGLAVVRAMAADPYYSRAFLSP